MKVKKYKEKDMEYSYYHNYINRYFACTGQYNRNSC